MKKLLAFLLLFGGHYAASAQFFKHEKVNIYGIDFKAKEVTGQRLFVGPTHKFRTKISTPLVTKRSDDYHIDLGSYRPNGGTMQTVALFNMSLQGNSSPILDSIDLDYYCSYGFSEVERETPSILLDKDYLEFKSYLVDSSQLTVKKKKQYLNKAKPLYRNMLLMSRYEIYKNNFNIDKKKISKFTSDLKARLDTLKINNVEVKADVKAYLSKLAEEATVIKGYYVDARLHSFYINKINYYIKTTPKINLKNDEFAFNLKDYLESKTAAANTSLVAIQLDGTFDRTKISIDDLSADLTSKFQMPASDALNIAASVNVAYTKSEETTFKNKFNNLFIIRYFTSSIIDDLDSPIEFVEGL